MLKLSRLFPSFATIIKISHVCGMRFVLLFIIKPNMKYCNNLIFIATSMRFQKLLAILLNGANISISAFDEKRLVFATVNRALLFTRSLYTNSEPFSIVHYLRNFIIEWLFPHFQFWNCSTNHSNNTKNWFLVGSYYKTQYNY